MEKYKKVHKLGVKEISEYQKMLNQWETTNIGFKIIKEKIKWDSNEWIVAFHIVKTEEIK